MAVVNISVAGAGGRMGKAVIAEAENRPDIKISGLFEKAGHALTGSEISGVNIHGTVEEASCEADVVVDFTSPEATLSNALYCSQNGKAMVIGTTGFSEKQKNKLAKLAKSFPCVLASNMSVGVNLVEQLVRFAAEKLGDDFDIEIVETHHSAKKDVPSGTALALARAAAGARKQNFEETAVCGRKKAGARGKKEIGIQSVRGGGVRGDHTVLFLGGNERVEISHHADSRDIFASGAIKAAVWVCGKPAGIYGIREALDL